MAFVFTPATKEQAKARIALDGPSGSGKTYTALITAEALGERIAVIDTERGSAAKYADEFTFDNCVLTSFSPDDLTAALGAAAAAGYDVVIVDSLSHFWSGKSGMKDQATLAGKRNYGGNSFGGWADAKPMEQRMIDALVSYPGHVIVTMRTKTEYVIEDNANGRKVPRKIGLKPDQRDGLEYEFDVVGSMDHENTLVVTKSRCRALSGAVVQRPTEEFGQQIAAWLQDGTKAETVEELITAALDPKATFQDLKTLMERIRARRAQGTAMLDPNGAPTTLEEYVYHRGRTLKAHEAQQPRVSIPNQSTPPSGGAGGSGDTSGADGTHSSREGAHAAAPGKA